MLNAAAEARHWLFDELLPFWAAHGLDPAGGFHDQLDDQGKALPLAKRCRVQARQIYVFAEAGRMGWNGPWRACVDHGLAYLTTAFARPDGLVRAKASGVDGIVDGAADNYDQAFTLFALAKAYERTGDAALVSRALAMLATLRAQRAHSAGGFHEANPPVAPLRSNPHMHLFEAAIAWIEAAALAPFRALAEEIAALALDRLIDPASGALREYFDLAWQPQAIPAGQIVEPGHQFEWAWLLTRFHALGGSEALIPAARRLYAFAALHGVDASRNVAFNEVWADGRSKDSVARLWPQTERLKGALAMAELDGDERAADAVAAWEGMKQYRLPTNPALFRDKLAADGTFLIEPSFASSVYHITCAIAEFDRVARDRGQAPPPARCLPPARVRQAVILVGGKGTRLGSLTKATPKPLMPIADDRVFLDLLIDNIVRQGFDRIVLLAGHLGEQIAERYDGHHIRGAAIRVMVEPVAMGTGGALRFAAGVLEDRFLLANGDTYFDMNYRALDRAFASHDGCIGTIALRRVTDAGRYGTVLVQDAPIGGAVRIDAFHEKAMADLPTQGLINAGTYLLSRDILEHVPEGASSLEQDVFPTAAAAGRLAGVEAAGYFIDIGLPETLSQARADLPGAICRPALFLDRDGVLNHDHNYVHRWADYDWIEDARMVVRIFNDAGYLVFVVTNQAGIAHGYYDEEAVNTLHDRIQDALALDGAFVDQFFYCPYHPDGQVAAYRAADHADRKPAPGMILRALAEWPVDRTGSFLVGDRTTDIRAAEGAGLPGLLFPGGSLYDFIRTQGRLPLPADGSATT